MSHQRSNSSDSPTSEVPSNNTSPAQLLASLTSNDNDPQTSHSHDTPSRLSIDLPRSGATSKGGCWTCRLRRKKCDEQREGDSCHTCNRLKIKCLGWGPKRPDWMRDKQAVEAYKADIKAQLTRAGMIRGQPKPPVVQAKAVSSSVFTTQQYQGSSSSVPHTASDPRPAPSLIFDGLSQGTNPGESSTMMSALAREAVMGDIEGTADVYTATSSTSRHSPHGLPPQFDHNFSQLSTHSPYTPPPPLPSSHPSPHDLLHFTPTFDNHIPSTTAFNPEVNAATLSSHNPQVEHVLYYFERVCRIQFPFASTAAESITYSLVKQSPHGPLTNALCALASLHDACIRAAGGIESSTADNSQAFAFYDNAHAQLRHNSQGILTEMDANAALHLLSFSMFSGGSTEWQPMLDIVNEWFLRTGITAHDNPKLAIVNMSSAARLALKSTMWLDVISTVTLLGVPRYLQFYRRLYLGGGGFWAASGRYTLEELDTRVESLTACPDEIMLGIAEISSLECWKVQEMRKGTLSMRELIRRVDILERHLRIDCEPACALEADQTRLHPGSAMGGDPTATGLPRTASPADVARQLVAKIFRETALVYLHTVLNGSYPGVPEIIQSVDVIVQLLRQLPVSIMDRGLMFPIYLAGCLTDDAVQRDVLRTRLLGIQDGFRNVHQTVQVLETVWHRRDSRGGAVEWRDLLQVQGRHRLLLV
ncbi:fungal-specific transcription factor domain-containing protein [Pisolithus thermaeus]|nr:fungal-specific transcription factor domain-containing protein [Pisolithus thermaeus]